MALRRIPIPSPNFSSRGGATVRLLVLHTAEGAQSLESLGAFFKSSSAQVSSHVGIDSTPNTVGEYVRRDWKAWTASNANPIAVQAEICAFARWTTAEWNKHPAMLRNVADWLAEEAHHFGIPLVRLSPAQAQGSGRGVCQHKDLGAWGGGHVDCGPGFPLDHVLEMAHKPAPKPKPKPDTGEAHAAVTHHLGRHDNVWEVRGTPGKDAHFGGPDRWEEAIIGQNMKTGAWRIRKK